RAGKHGARSTRQAIAIGLSKARRAGVDLPPPKKGKTSEKTRRSAERAYETGQKGKSQPSRTRSQATEKALKRKGRAAASSRALSEQAHSAASERTPGERSAAARKAAQTKGPKDRSAPARKPPTLARSLKNNGGAKSLALNRLFRPKTASVLTPPPQGSTVRKQEWL
ncbi:MAG: DUF6496 domain-containing protein, partial [Gammaproteobacteria bacterium]